MSVRLFLRYWHTLRHLRPIQIYGRIGFKLLRPNVDLRPAPGIRDLKPGLWVAPASRLPSLVGATRFQFLNESHDLVDHGWDDPALEKLWRYNQHYFDDLNALGSAARVQWHLDLLQGWVQDNPPGVGTGWEPYPTSLRMVNWVKWALVGNVLPPECIHCLAVQARWLSGRLEIHLLGNHLFVNAKALVFAGLYFSGAEADRWLARGLHILANEVPEQILSDGGQFERSTMYHALALEDLLDLVNVMRSYRSDLPTRWFAFVDSLESHLGRMCRWLAVMSHPDNSISFFNDAAFGVAPTNDELAAYSQRLGLPAACRPVDEGAIHLAESGYVRVQHGPLAAMLDVAPVGPDYLPGHAHADTLSFELSLFGQRVLVNSGTSCYGLGTERLRQRGTAAHNTLELDGLDSTEVWGGFRVARRARPIELKIDQGEGSTVISCAHDGYRRLPGKPVHQRIWHLACDRLRVTDTVTGLFNAGVSRFYLHPDIRVMPDRRLQLTMGHVVAWTITDGEGRIVNSTWHPAFGVSVPSHCIEVVVLGPTTTIEFTWE